MQRQNLQDYTIPTVIRLLDKKSKQDATTEINFYSDQYADHEDAL